MLIYLIISQASNYLVPYSTFRGSTHPTISYDDTPGSVQMPDRQNVNVGMW